MSGHLFYDFTFSNDFMTAILSLSFMTEKMTVELSEDKEEVVVRKIKKLVEKEEPDVKVEEL